MAKKKKAIDQFPKDFPPYLLEIAERDWVRAMGVTHREVHHEEPVTEVYDTVMSLLRVILRIEIWLKSGDIDPDEAGPTIRELASEVARLLQRDY